MSAIFQTALEQSIETTRRNLGNLDDFPESFKHGAWQTIEKERAAGHWVDGFWTGLLWLAYAHTGDASLRAGAERWTSQLAHLKTNTGTHDLGFIFYLSHVIAGRLTADAAFFDNAKEAAYTLIKRFNPRGEYLQAWDDDGIRKWAGRSNIDLMMNLALLYWAGDATGDQTLADIATLHARTSRLALVRGDGSTAHVADFDPRTGLLIRREQYQGYSHDSCWSRGQAWALYGFATCYRYTSRPAFLATARTLADYTACHLPADLVPFWDYNSPHIPNTYRDSSAGSVTVCGLLELAAVDSEHATRWLGLAERMLISLCENYLMADADGPAAILRDGARSVPANLMEHGLIYGDYYFMEALTAFTRPDIHQRAFATRSVLSEASG